MLLQSFWKTAWSIILGNSMVCVLVHFYTFTFSLQLLIHQDQTGILCDLILALKGMYYQLAFLCRAGVPPPHCFSLPLSQCYWMESAGRLAIVATSGWRLGGDWETTVLWSPQFSLNLEGPSSEHFWVRAVKILVKQQGKLQVGDWVCPQSACSAGRWGIPIKSTCLYFYAVI